MTDEDTVSSPDAKREAVLHLYGPEKLYEVSWFDGRVEHVVAHTVDVPGSRDRPALEFGKPADRIQESTGLIVFKRHDGTRNAVVLAISANLIKTVRLVPDENVGEDDSAEEES